MRLFELFSWRRLLAVLLLWAYGSASALAAMTITNILVNGGSTANVPAGSPITVKVTVKLEGGGSKWRSTYFTTSPGSSIDGCITLPDHAGPGTYPVEFVGRLNAPATQDNFALNVWAFAHPNCGSSQEWTSATLPNAINTAPAVAALNHVRIQHDGTGLNCSPEVITLRACADASCLSPFTGSVSVTLPTLPAGEGTWSANPVIISGGQATVSLSRSVGGTVLLSGTVTSPAAASTAAVCYKNGVAGDCNLAFGEASCQLDAVEVGTGPNTPIFTRRVNAPVVLDVLTLVNGVLTSNRAGDVQATIVDASSGSCSTTPLSDTVTLRYNSSNLGRRTFTLTPTAASANARVRLVSSTLLQCSSDNFAIRPASFTVTGSAVQDPSGVSVSTVSPLKAGTTPFSLTAASFTGYTGTPRIAAARVAAADVSAGVAGTRGTLSGSFGASAAGSAAGSAFRYSEVGYFRLLSYGVYDDGSFTLVDGAKGECFTDARIGGGTALNDPNVTDGSGKIGCYFGSGDTSFFGRFVPDRFIVGPGLVFKDRSALASCVAPGFSYMGEAMAASVPLVAKNGTGGTTSNYTGRFNRFTAATQLGAGVVNDPPATARTLFAPCGAAPAHPCVTQSPVAGGFVDGEATIDFPVTAFRASTAVGPFEHVKVGIAPVDSDGVRVAAYDVDTVNPVAGSANHLLIGSTRLRYGRLNIDNAYGSELLNLTMRLTAQYWTGTAYATNTLDSCTAAGPSGFTLGRYSGAITAANMDASHVTGAVALAAGSGRLVLTRPTPPPDTRGSVVVTSVLPYLPGKGSATFGLYKAGPVIYVRETY